MHQYANKGAQKWRENWGFQSSIRLNRNVIHSGARLLTRCLNRRSPCARWQTCRKSRLRIRPDGKLYLADISNMPWARPDLKMLLSKVAYALEHNYPARGTYAA